ncbi:hypothetical protein [Bacteroides faecalis]|uniref:Uncharacterized protein n=1 Tax=Bacteroides faecalis TaxID=2447885 RepID=A0A401LZZ0_9BACE|nr:hypothetical protein [Bacteroides faecalis]GCB37140.1 hypothetical protein KGMB02408_40850 [Bacteroides faecalis]
MKKLQLMIVSFLLPFTLQAQRSTVLVQQTDTSIINIYEYGQPISSCECNFENLFRNWTTQFVTNAKDIELISYEFIERLSDNNIDSYINLLTCPNVLASAFHASNWTNTTFSEDSIIQKTEKRVRYVLPQFYTIEPGTVPSIPVIEHEKVLDELKKKATLKKELIRKIVSTNDKVYLILFKYGGQTLKNYVICSSKTNRVICDNVFKVVTSFKSNMLLY